MKLEDITLGMRVVPTQKTAAPEGQIAGLAYSTELKKAQADGRNWLYVISWPTEGAPGEMVLGALQSTDNGDYFMAADVELYKCEHQ